MARRRRFQEPEPFKENNQWKIKYYDYPNGKPRRRTKCLGKVRLMTLRDARRERSVFLAPINAVSAASEHTDKTMADLCQEWVRVKAPLRKQGEIQQYVQWAFPRLVDWFGPVPLAALRKRDIEEFLTSQRRKDGGLLSDHSVRDLLSCIRCILNVAVEWEWLDRSPASTRFILPKRKPARKKIIWDPVTEFRRFIEAAPILERTLVTIACMGGLRVGEITALRLRCIQPDGLYIHEAAYQGVVSTPKTQAGIRLVPVPATVQAVLSDWLRVSPAKHPDDFLFSGKRGQVMDLDRVLYHRIRPLCDRLGIRRVNWHDQRHTFTTWARRAGVRPEVLKQILGHSHISVTLGIYSHADDTECRAAVESVAALAFGNSTQTGTPMNAIN